MSLPEQCAANNMEDSRQHFMRSEAVKQATECFFTAQHWNTQMTTSCEHICSLFTRMGIFRVPDRHINAAQLRFCSSRSKRNTISKIETFCSKLLHFTSASLLGSLLIQSTGYLIISLRFEHWLPVRTAIASHRKTTKEQKQKLLFCRNKNGSNCQLPWLDLNVFTLNLIKPLKLQYMCVYIWAIQISQLT